MVGSFLCILQHREFAQLLKGISHLWFLLTIFECYAFFYFTKGLFTEKGSWYILGASILALCIYYISPFHFLGLGPFFKYAPYYAIGMSLCRLNLQRNPIIQKYSKHLFFIILTGYLCLFCLNANRGIVLLTDLFLIITAFMSLENLKNINVPPAVQSLDKCSMGIYIVHHIIIQEMNKISAIEPFLHTHYYLYPILQFILVLLLSWFIVFVLQKNTYSKYIIG